MNQQQLKFIWPVALVVITAFLMMIGIVGGFIDPKILMIWRKFQIEKRVFNSWNISRLSFYRWDDYLSWELSFKRAKTDYLCRRDVSRLKDSYSYLLISYKNNLIKQRTLEQAFVLRAFLVLQSWLISMTIKNGQNRRMNISKKRPLTEKKALRKTIQVITSSRDDKRLSQESVDF